MNGLSGKGGEDIQLRLSCTKDIEHRAFKLMPLSYWTQVALTHHVMRDVTPKINLIFFKDDITSILVLLITVSILKRHAFRHRVVGIIPGGKTSAKDQTSTGAISSWSHIYSAVQIPYCTTASYLGVEASAGARWLGPIPRRSRRRDTEIEGCSKGRWNDVVWSGLYFMDELPLIYADLVILWF